MGSPSLLPSCPFLLLHPLLQAPCSDPHSSPPEVITEQGPMVTVTARPSGERGCAAPGSAGVWRGLAVVLRACVRVCLRVCVGPASASQTPGAGRAKGFGQGKHRLSCQEAWSRSIG